MSYTFPHFDDIPYPELINFADPYDIVDVSYCEKHGKGSCTGCVFEATDSICATNSREYISERRALLAYVKLHHPEYLL